MPNQSLNIATYVLTLALAALIGFQLSCSAIAVWRLRDAVASADAARVARQRADELLERAKAILQQADAERRQQSDRAPRAHFPERIDAGQVSSL